MVGTATSVDRAGVGQTVERRLMLVDGEWVGSAGGQFFTVENPARRGDVIAEVPRAGAEDVDRAVQAAARAFESWRLVAPRDRGKRLLRIAEALQAEAEEIARTIALETGNALRPQSRPEANNAADIFR